MLKPVVRLSCEVPKQGEPPEDCQDAVAAAPERGRFAIADGATVSFFPRQWARRLTLQFCTADAERIRPLLSDGSGWPRWLRPAIAAWRAEVEEFVTATAAPQRLLLRNRLDEDDYAAATFVGLLIDPAAGFWRAVAVGDSCLFHVRNGRLLASFPLESSAQFDSTPDCLITRDTNVVAAQSFTAGETEVGDLFLLATDALAKWLLLQREAGEHAWRVVLESLLRVGSWGEFYELVQRTRRDEGALDDDVSVLIVSLEPARGPAPFQSEGWKDVPSSKPERPRFPTPAAERERQPPIPIIPEPVKSARKGAERWRNALRAHGGTLIALVLALAGLGFSVHAQAKLRGIETRVAALEKEVTQATAPVALSTPDVSPGGARMDTLPADVAILTEPRAGAAPLLVLQQPAPATRKAAASPDWIQVELLFWVAEKSSQGNTLVLATDDSVDAARGTRVRAGPEAVPETLLGTTGVPGRFALVAQRPDPRLGRWLQLRAAGYIRTPQ